MKTQNYRHTLARALGLAQLRYGNEPPIQQLVDQLAATDHGKEFVWVSRPDPDRIVPELEGLAIAAVDELAVDAAVERHQEQATEALTLMALMARGFLQLNLKREVEA